MTRPRLLDLFCGAGGASYGYALAGFDVVGVDIAPQPHYPFTFYRDDALTFPTDDFDVIHASPPCQAFSTLQARTRHITRVELIAPIRERLVSTGRPYVIENVEGAPLVRPVRLCGTQFPGLRVIRHRLFESNVPLVGTDCGEHPLVFTRDKRKQHCGQLDQNTSFVQVTGGGNCTVANARAAMGITWMTKRELNEAIPPAYTTYIGKQLLSTLPISSVFISAPSSHGS